MCSPVTLGLYTFSVEENPFLQAWSYVTRVFVKQISPSDEMWVVFNNPAPVSFIAEVIPAHRETRVKDIVSKGILK